MNEPRRRSRRLAMLMVALLVGAGAAVSGCVGAPTRSAAASAPQMPLGDWWPDSTSYSERSR